MSVPVHSAISKGMRNTEHLWSRKMVKIMEKACIENTNRVAYGTVNALLHRELQFSLSKQLFAVKTTAFYMENAIFKT